MADSVTISVKLFATLKRFLPVGSEDGVSLTLPQGATVQDVVAALKIPPEQTAMLVAGDTYVQIDTPLTEGMELNIFPPLAGGV